MSDSLPENEFSGILKVVKLISGEELIGLVSEAMPDRITIKLPAKLETYMSKDQNNSLTEFVKLTNYLSNVRGFEVNISRSSILYIAQPAIDLEKMYEIYFITMQTDPKSIVTSGPENSIGHENGLALLNELFNNEDFVGFVNDLIENFEGVEILAEDEDYEDHDSVVESDMSDSEPQEPPSPPKPKKRNRMKPEKKTMPYNPEAEPNNPESWPDDPNEYLN
jgi:hypothetical protein